MTTERPYAHAIVTLTRNPKDGFDASLRSPDGPYRGWGRTEETATLDAFAVWRVDRRRNKSE